LASIFDIICVQDDVLKFYLVLDAWRSCVYIYSVPTSQETRYVTATKPNRLMLFREIIAVYCENHTEHTNTLCGQNAEFSSYLTGNTLVSATKPNLLMLFREIIAVYCENHM
jgi:hypothetical protein